MDFREFITLKIARLVDTDSCWVMNPGTETVVWLSEDERVTLPLIAAS